MSEFSLEFVEEYIDASRRCTRPIELRDALMAHVSRFGFDDLAAIAVLDDLSVIRVNESTEKQSLRIGTYSDDWKERFFEQGYAKVDPVAMKMETALSPYFWDDCAQEHKKTVGRSRLFDQFEAESLELSLVRGVTIPIDNVDGKSTISFCGKEAENGPGIMHMMHLIGIYFQQKILALSDALSASQPRQAVRLTPRETEVLRWYANGKSAWDIGVVLSVSEAAVRFHLSNIRGKYGVNSSVHATALAVSRSDIQI